MICYFFNFILLFFKEKRERSWERERERKIWREGRKERERGKKVRRNI